VRAVAGGLVGLAVALGLSALLRPASAGGIPSLEYDGDAMRQEPLSVALVASQRFGSVVVALAVRGDSPSPRRSMA
jgi:hypothetical protein